MPPTGSRPDSSAVRPILRVVVIVIVAAGTLALIYVLRKPLVWLVLATFLAVALSGPVNLLDRRMPRGLAIAVVYLCLLAIPVALAALVIPPLVREGNELISNIPAYAADVQEFVKGNATLQGIEEDYGITSNLESQAKELPSKIGDAASALGGLGVGLVNSLFALVTILILAAFMLGGGKGWIHRALELQPRERAVRIRRVLDRSARAVGGYVVGALAVAFIAGTLAFVVLTILGVPFKGPLAVIVGAFSLIPLVGATIAAIIVGIVTLFNDFPTATIVWTVWAIVYQQLENNLLQPQIHKRTVEIQPFVVLVAVLFGGTLMGVLGAILAIPAAATIQIILAEWWAWRTEGEGDGVEVEGEAAAPAAPGDRPADARDAPAADRPADAPAKDRPAEA
jgi:predicted PurR-regulated permease PerM